MDFRYILAWLPMSLLAVINGALRESTYGKRVPELRAHQISTITGMVMMCLFCWWIVRLWGFHSASQAIYTGLVWLAMTVAFEFLAGHYLFGNSWEKLFRDYDLRKGRLWGLFLLWLTVLPYLLYRF